MSAPVQILLAEDSPADRRLMTEALLQHHIHHEMQVASDGEQALNAVRAAGNGDKPCPDLLIIDLNLPRVDGIQILRAFRQNEHCRNTPVLVLTSSSSPADRDQAEQFDGIYFMHKPFELDQFLAIGQTVRNLLVKAQGQ
jgi:two-component system, chemotaxis family, response regulator Rcp1